MAYLLLLPILREKASSYVFVFADARRQVGIAHKFRLARMLDILSILQEYFLIVSNMLVVDCQITHNGFSGSW